MRTVVTAVFGGYEKIKAPPTGVDRAVLITDGATDDRWETIVRPSHGISPRRHIFCYKLIPHIMISAHDDVLWIDGSFDWTGKPVSELFDLVPAGSLGIHAHPAPRAGYWEEAEFSARHYGDNDRGIHAMAQANHYLARGCQPNGPVWASGILVWRGAQRRLGERWFAETMAWSASDQIALPYVLHETGLTVTTLPGSVYANPWFEFFNHGTPGRTGR